MATNVNDPYGLIGKWRFNEVISIRYLGFDPKIIFSSNGFSYNRMYVDSSSLTYGDYSPDYTPVNRLFHQAFTPTGGWANPEYRTVVITGGDSLTNETFANWLTANATQQADPTPTDEVTIEYNGSVIASLKAGQSATLHTADKPMLSDVVVTVPDGMGAGEVVEEWDGSYTVSGGTISFTIDGDHYEAEDGMTWLQWLGSPYNTADWSNIMPPGGSGHEIGRPYSGSQSIFVTYNEVYVMATDVIIADAAYGVKIVSGGGGGAN